MVSSPFFFNDTINKSDLAYQKGAALIIQLGQEETKKILKFLKQEDVQKLLYWVEKIEDISHQTSDQAIQEFYAYSTKQQKIYSHKWMENWLREINQMHLEGSSTNQSENDQTRKNDLLQILSNADSKELAEFLKNEKETTIALLLSYIEARRAVEILLELPTEKLEEVVIGIAEIQKIDIKSINELESALVSKWGSFGKRKDPLLFLAECLSLMPVQLQHRLLEKLSIRDFSQFTHLREMLENTISSPT